GPDRRRGRWRGGRRQRAADRGADHRERDQRPAAGRRPWWQRRRGRGAGGVRPHRRGGGSGLWAPLRDRGGGVPCPARGGRGGAPAPLRVRGGGRAPAPPPRPAALVGGPPVVTDLTP